MFKPFAVAAAFFGSVTLAFCEYWKEEYPYKDYNQEMDTELHVSRVNLKEQTTNKWDGIYINKLKRPIAGRVWKHNWLHPFEKYDYGTVINWTTSQNERCMGLVRADGKVFGEVIKGKCYEEGTVLRADIKDGYLYGVADNYLFDKEWFEKNIFKYGN